MTIEWREREREREREEWNGKGVNKWLVYYNKRQAQLIIKTSIIILHRFMVANIGKFNTNKIRCGCVSTLVVVFFVLMYVLHGV